MLKNLIDGNNIDLEIIEAIKEIHVNGPTNPIIFEKLAYIKRFHNDILKGYESKLINLMGLFYKNETPTSLLEEIYSIFSKSIYSEIKKKFTPIQADAYKKIHEKTYFSFSAPTSTGKSFLFRELIRDTKGDIIIVVPSRALISEYFFEVINIADKSNLVLQFIENVNIENINLSFAPENHHKHELSHFI